MIKTTLNAAGPIVAAVGFKEGAVGGISSGTLGTALLIIMALAVIANQLWTLFDKARRAIRSPEADTTALEEFCGLRHAEIEKALAGLKTEDARQDRINTEQFQTISAALVELRHELQRDRDALRQEFRTDIKGLHKRSDDVLRAVSRLEGKVN